MNKLFTALIASVIGLAQVQPCLGSNNDTLKKLQENAPTSSHIAQGFLRERATSCKQNPLAGDTKQSVEDKVFATNFYKRHDVEIKVTREECDGNQSVILETSVFGKIGDFEGSDILENEKGMLKFVLIKAYQQALEKYKEKNQNDPIVVLVDSHTKVTIRPQFATIKKNQWPYGSMFNHQEELSKDIKGMSMLTVFSKAEFDVLTKKHFNA
jgi:hypothetical protein